LRFKYIIFQQGWSYDWEVAVEDDVIIRLQTFSSFSHEQRWNVLGAGKTTPGTKLV